MTYQRSFDFGEAAVPQPSVPTSEQCGESQTALGPLAYELRVSARAKRVSLRVVPGRGLVVTVPRRFPRRQVAAVVEAHREWAQAALAEVDARTPEIYRGWPPSDLALSAMDLRVRIVFTTDGTSRLTLRDEGGHGTLRLACDAEDRPAVAAGVATILRQLAKVYLTDRAGQLSNDYGLQYQRLSVRGQRSVWGSYSSSGTLSLNYKLLFLRPALVDYVIAHELAHTVHLDHSPAFWAALEALNPDARALDAELSDAGQCVPPWLELAR